MTGEQIQSKVHLDEGESFSTRQSYGRRLVTPIRYTTDARDVGWVRENIPCQTACPADTNVPAYIQMILEGRYGRSYEVNRFANVLPGTLGRICSRPCEDACRHGWPGNGEPVNICHLKRAAADHKPSGHRITENLFTPSGKRVAVIGAGPAGLAAAHDLSMLGHDVTILEQEEIAGGMLHYGIPAFRLPRDVLSVEVRNALRLGVELRTGVSVGRNEGDVRLSGLLADYDAVLLATGCMAAIRLPLKGMDGGDEDPVRALADAEYGLDFLVELHRGAHQEGGQAGRRGRRRLHRPGLRPGVASGSAPRTSTIHIRTTEEYIVGHQGGDLRGQARGGQDHRPADHRRPDHRRRRPPDRGPVRPEPARRLARRRPPPGDPDRRLGVRRALRHPPGGDRPEDGQRFPRRSRSASIAGATSRSTTGR